MIKKHLTYLFTALLLVGISITINGNCKNSFPGNSGKKGITVSAKMNSNSILKQVNVDFDSIDKGTKFKNTFSVISINHNFSDSQFYIEPVFALCENAERTPQRFKTYLKI